MAAASRACDAAGLQSRRKSWAVALIRLPITVAGSAREVVALFVEDRLVARGRGEIQRAG